MTEPLAERGRRTRAEVLGPAAVARSAADAPSFNAPLTELVTEYCWGWLWTREGLPRQTRSLINIALLSVLNRRRELQTHVVGALRNGCSVEMIQEALLHVAVYAGVPAGVDSFAAVREAIDAYRAETPDQSPAEEE